MYLVYPVYLAHPDHQMYLVYLVYLENHTILEYLGWPFYPNMDYQHMEDLDFDLFV
jgi:hypothetical protein